MYVYTNQPSRSSRRASRLITIVLSCVLLCYLSRVDILDRVSGIAVLTLLSPSLFRLLEPLASPGRENTNLAWPRVASRRELVVIYSEYGVLQATRYHVAGTLNHWSKSIDYVKYGQRCYR